MVSNVLNLWSFWSSLPFLPSIFFFLCLDFYGAIFDSFICGASHRVVFSCSFTWVNYSSSWTLVSDYFPSNCDPSVVCKGICLLTWEEHASTFYICHEQPSNWYKCLHAPSKADACWWVSRKAWWTWMQLLLKNWGL